MFGKVFRELGLKVVVRIIAALVIALLAFVFSPMKNQITHLDLSLGIVSGVLFAALIVRDTLWLSQIRRLPYAQPTWIEFLVLAKYVVATLAFVLVVTLSSVTLLERQIPFLVVALVVLTGDVSLVLLRIHSVAFAHFHESETGFAVTGILVVDAGSTNAEPYFVLVYNSNLRGGLGLWVPPGGHYEPYSDDSPLSRLMAKIQSEVGMNASLVHPYDVRLHPTEPVRKIEGTSWLPPPVFYLKEDLQGKCSWGHRKHLDFVYICQSDGIGLPSVQPSYPQALQVHVPVKDCVGSSEAAERAIVAKIDLWKHGRGMTAGRRDDLVVDVAWRLHLAAKILADAQPAPQHIANQRTGS